MDNMSSDTSSDDLTISTDCYHLYEKQRWLKVTFNFETKRILDPPLDL